jgi:hypothetical protein
VTDISESIGVTFAATAGGDSILRLHNPPNLAKTEIHFAGVDERQHFIHFWRDAKRRWHSEDLTAKTGQRVAHPVNHYLSSGGGLSAAKGPHATAGPITVHDYIVAITPESRPVVFFDDVSTRDWKVLDVPAAAGFKIRPPELPWGDSSANHLVFAAQR